MGIIKYFRRLKEYFNYRKEINKERDRKFYEKSRQGIFSFFDAYKTRNGFYLELNDKKGLINYLFNKKEIPKETEKENFEKKKEKDKTIEDKVLTNSGFPLSLSMKNFQERIDSYNQKIYSAFERLIEYFKEIKKEGLEDYSGLSFYYNPSMNGMRKKENKKGLEVMFG
jgi:RNAse (barnase) inhibitor barstar